MRRRLLVSSRSNLGGWLVSAWGGANHDGAGRGGGAVPPVFDMEEANLTRITAARLAPPDGRYFCDLAWGSRKGLCRSNESVCDLPWERRGGQGKHPAQTLRCDERALTGGDEAGEEAGGGGVRRLHSTQ